MFCWIRWIFHCVGVKHSSSFSVSTILWYISSPAFMNRSEFVIHILCHILIYYPCMYRLCFLFSFILLLFTFYFISYRACKASSECAGLFLCCLQEPQSFKHGTAPFKVMTTILNEVCNYVQPFFTVTL